MQNSVTQPQLRRFMYAKAAHNRMPLSGTFELTPRCNLNCRMCYIHLSESELCARGRERTAEEWISLGRECAQRGMLFLLLTGGEPFLREDFREIYTELKKLGLLITINTNATLIDEQTVQWLSADAPSKVNVTLYGANNDTYRRLCGCADGYERATRGVELMRQAGILVNINASFTKLNQADMAPIADFGLSRDLKVNPATYMFPPVRRDSCVAEGIRFSPDEAGIARARGEILTADSSLLNVRLQALHAGHLSLDPEMAECERTADEKMGCMAGKASFWVNWDGSMSPCGMMTTPLAWPFDTGFEDAWQSLIQVTEEICLPPECSSCAKRSACMICAALSMAEGAGDSRRKPEYLCRMTEAYLAEMEAEYGRRFGENQQSVYSSADSR